MALGLEDMQARASAPHANVAPAMLLETASEEDIYWLVSMRAMQCVAAAVEWSHQRKGVRLLLNDISILGAGAL